MYHLYQHLVAKFSSFDDLRLPSRVICLASTCDNIPASYSKGPMRSIQPLSQARLQKAQETLDGLLDAILMPVLLLSSEVASFEAERHAVQAVLQRVVEALGEISRLKTECQPYFDEFEKYMKRSPSRLSPDVPAMPSAMNPVNLYGPPAGTAQHQRTLLTCISSRAGQASAGATESHDPAILKCNDTGCEEIQQTS